MATLRNENVRREGPDWYLDYEMEKTGMEVGNLLPPPAVELLHEYYDSSGDPDDFVFNVLEGYDVSTPESRYLASFDRERLNEKIGDLF